MLSLRHFSQSVIILKQIQGVVLQQNVYRMNHVIVSFILYQHRMVFHAYISFIVGIQTRSLQSIKLNLSLLGSILLAGQFCDSFTRFPENERV